MGLLSVEDMAVPSLDRTTGAFQRQMIRYHLFQHQNQNVDLQMEKICFQYKGIREFIIQDFSMNVYYFDSPLLENPDLQ